MRWTCICGHTNEVSSKNPDSKWKCEACHGDRLDSELEEATRDVQSFNKERKV